MCNLGKSGSKNQTTTQVNSPPAQVLQNYQEVYDAAKQVAGTPYQPYQGQMVAPLGNRQNAALGTIDQAQGMMLPFVGQAAGFTNLGGQSFNPMDFTNDAVARFTSPYTDQVVNTTMANLRENDAQQQQQVIGNAIARGAWGGDRAGVAQAELARQQALANGQTIAGLRNQGFNQALGEFNTQQAAQLGAQQNNATRALQAGLNMGQLGQLAQSGVLGGAAAQLQGGTLEQQNQQAAINAAIQQYQTGQQYPFQTLGWLSNIAQGLGSNSGGSSTNTSPGPSTASQIAGLGTSGLGLLGATGAFGSTGWLTGGLGSAGAAAGAAGGSGLLSTIGSALASIFADGGRVPYADGGAVDADGSMSIDPRLFIRLPNSAPRGPMGPGPGRPNAQPAVAAKGLGDVARDSTNTLMQFRRMGLFGGQGGMPAPTTSGGFSGQVGDLTQGLADRQGYADGGFAYENPTGDLFMTPLPPAPARGLVPPRDFDVERSLNEVGVLDRPPAAPAAPSAGLAPLAPPVDVATRPVAAVSPAPAARPSPVAGLDATAMRESGGDRYAKNPNSSAYGPHQFIDKTWSAIVESPEGRAAGLTLDGRDDPRQSSIGNRIYRSWNAQALESKGLQPTEQNLYASHFLGTAGGPRFAAAAQKFPDAPAFQFAQPEQVAANKSVFFNKDGSPKTAGQVYAWMGGGKSGFDGVSSNTTLTGGPGTDTVRAPGQKAGIGDNTDLWLSVMAAGLGMMGGTSPFAGVNIGQGGLQGLQFYQNLQKNKREQANTESEIERRSSQNKTDAQRLLQDAERFRGEQAIQSQNAATSRMNVESEVKTRLAQQLEVRVGTNPTTGEQGYLVFDRTAPEKGLRFFSAEQAMAAGIVPAPTGGGATPAAGAPAGSGVPPAAAPAAGAPAAPQAPRPSTDIVTDIPKGFVPRNQFVTENDPDMKKAQLAAALDEVKNQRERALKLREGNMRLAEMDRSISALPRNALLQPGTLGDERARLAAAANTLAEMAGLRAPFDKNNIADIQQLQKDTFRLGADLSASIGGREPGFIVQAAVGANPGINNTREGYEKISAGLRAANDYVIARAQFMDNYAARFKTLADADELFNKMNPPDKFAARAILQTVPQASIQKLRENPGAAAVFNATFGGTDPRLRVDLAKYVLGGP